MGTNRLVICILVGLLLLPALVAPPAGAGPGEPWPPGAPGPLPGAAPNAWHLELVRQIGGACSAVVVQGERAYVGIGRWLVVLDISNPARPIVLGESAALLGTITSVALSGTLAYVAEGDGGLCILRSLPSAFAFLPLVLKGR